MAESFFSAHVLANSIFPSLFLNNELLIYKTRFKNVKLCAQPGTKENIIRVGPFFSHDFFWGVCNF